MPKVVTGPWPTVVLVHGGLVDGSGWEDVYKIPKLRIKGSPWPRSGEPLMKASFDKTALGITENDVPLGSQLIHFWHSDAERRANNAKT